MASGDMRIAIGTGAAVSITGSAAYAGAATGQGSSSAFAKAAAINASGVGSLTATADTTSVYAYAATTGVGYTLNINGQAITTAGTTALTGSENPDDGGWAWEWWYKFQITDNITLTPALIYLARPLGQATPLGESFNQFGGLIKTSFKF
jgi:hypothetical protein